MHDATRCITWTRADSGSIIAEDGKIIAGKFGWAGVGCARVEKKGLERFQGV